MRASAGASWRKRFSPGSGPRSFYSFANKLLALWREVPRLIATGPTSAYPNATLTQRDHAGVPGCRLHHRPAHLRHHGVGQRPVVARAHPAALDAGARSRRSGPTCLKLGFTPEWMAANSHATWIYRAYVRYIGAGAVAMAGLMTLLRTLPTIYSSIRDSVRELRARRRRQGTAADRAGHADHLGRVRLRRHGGADPDRSEDARRLSVGAAAQPADRRLRLLLRGRVVAHRRPHRLLFEPDLRDDDRDAARHVPHLRRGRLGERPERSRPPRRRPRCRSARSSASPPRTRARHRRI